jgi:hypothetical protein
MTDKPTDRNLARQTRLRAALRENLKRRKSQSRGRAGLASVTPDGDVENDLLDPKASEPAGPAKTKQQTGK